MARMMCRSAMPPWRPMRRAMRRWPARLPRPARLVCTPLSRTQATAAAHSCAPAIRTQTPLLDPAFVEQNFGALQGCPSASLTRPVSGMRAAARRCAPSVLADPCRRDAARGREFRRHDRARRRRAGAAGGRAPKGAIPSSSRHGGAIRAACRPCAGAHRASGAVPGGG